MAISLSAPNRALAIRSQAMNQRYGLPPVTAPKVPATKVTSRYSPTGGGSALPGSPNWGQAADYGWGGQTSAKFGTTDRYSSPFSSYQPPSFGGMPDYAALIGGDYGVQDMESQMNARMGRARGDFTSQLRRALIDLGVADKSKLGSLGQYIDEDTITQAAQNKYSRTAQTAQEENSRRAQSEADLAARGMLSSGQLTKTNEDILAAGEQARYSSLRDFLGAGEQGLSSLADLNDQLAGQLAQARFDAAARAAQMYQYGGYGGYDQGFGYDTAGAYGPTTQSITPVRAQAPKYVTPVKPKAKAPVWGGSRYWGAARPWW